MSAPREYDRMPPPMVPLPKHRLLPEAVQAELRKAAAIEPEMPLARSFKRVQAVESATFKARALHPSLFRK